MSDVSERDGVLRVDLIGDDRATVKAYDGASVDVEADAGTRVHVEVCYPRLGATPEVTVGLMDVRAADDIRLHYDFERDGWVVSQQVSVYVEDMGAGIGHPDGPLWREVAFIEAWSEQEQASTLADAPEWARAQVREV